MTKSPPLYCSDDLLQSLIEASHCSFVLLAMRQEDQPIDVFDVADLLRLDIIAADDLVNMLLRFGFILPVKDGSSYTISQSGIDMLSPAPGNSPFKFDPSLPYAGDRLPSYIAFDLLPLRIYAYRSKFSNN
jgi:hypothetical protein